MIKDIKEQGSAALVVVLVIIILAIVGAGGYYYWQYQKTGSVDSTETMMGKKTADELAGWQTYQNPTYPYSFKYPQDWYFITSGLNLPPPVTVMVADMPDGSDMTKYTSFHVFAVDAGGQTLEQYPEIINLEAQGEKKTNATVSGQKAYKFEQTDETFFTVSIYAKYGNDIYRIGYQIPLKPGSGTFAEKKTACEKILGTLVFGTSASESTPATTTSASGEIILGAVTLTDKSDLQSSVDQGHQPLYLDPVEVARMEGINYGFSQNDDYSLTKKEYTEAAGTYHAYVKAVHNGKTYTIRLIQPQTQGDSGIWTIDYISEE